MIIRHLVQGAHRLVKKRDPKAKEESTEPNQAKKGRKDRGTDTSLTDYYLWD